MLSQLRSTLVCTITFLGAATCTAQQTIHVPADQPTIQAAINAANNGDTVLVAPGTYYENIDFKGKAITVTSTIGTGGGAANTIIDGGGNGPAVTLTTGETRATVLSNLTVTHGGTILSNGANEGPGIDIANSQPTLLNNIITQNYCLGIYVFYAAPLIEANTVSSSLNPNKCSVSSGAGIFVTSDFSASPGEGTTIPALIIGNIIEKNSAGESGDGGGDGGAGIYVQGGSPLIQNNIIRNNEAETGNGGGIYISSSNVTVFQNLIYGNDAGCGGGGIAFEGGSDSAPFYVLIANNTIIDNTGGSGGGYSACQKISQIYAFPGTYGGSGPNAVLVNNIISGETSYPAINCSEFGDYSEADQPLFDHNLLYNSGGPFFGNYCIDTSSKYGNITLAPQFVDAASNNYQLLSVNSPGVDSGNNSILQSITDFSAAQVAKDFAGNPRLQDAKGIGYPIMDMGAYEYAGTVDAQATTIVLSSSAYTGSAGSNYVLTATLASPAGTPTGDVTFFLDGNNIGVAPIGNGGIATLSNFLLTPGVHSLYATYPGEGNFTPAKSVVIIVDISLYSPALTISSNPNPSNLGQSVKFNVNISSADTNQLGPIVVTNTNTNATLATLTPDASGNASFTSSSLPLGYNNIQANYAGDATHNSGSASVEQDVVSASATTTTLTSSLNPSTYGQSVTFKATVSAATTPTGSITFTDSATTLATVSLDASADAIYTTSSLTANDPGTTPNHPITATYNPPGSFATSSASLSQVVNGLPTTNTLTISPDSGTTATSYTLTATLKSASTVSTATPTGTVTFYISPSNSDPGIQIGAATLTNGVATLTSSTLPVSSGFAYELYAGDTIYANSDSNSINVNITAAPTTTTTLAITAAGAPVTTVATGTVVTLTATTLAGTSPVTPGVIHFCDATAPACTDIHLIGTAQLTASGTAILRFIPGPGTHSYKAVFLGTSTSNTSSSAAEPLTVGSSSNATTTLAATGAPGDYTLTATVTGSLTTPPTGTISFLDTTNSNYVLATAPLSPSTPSGPTFVNSSTLTLPIPSGGILAAGTGMAVGDFNGDGLQDLAILESPSPTFGLATIFLGDGAGSFAISSSFATGVDPTHIITADFNGDGFKDLAFSDLGSQQAEIWLNDGHGNFTFKSSYPTSAAPQGVVAADFNGDGIPDLAVVNGFGGLVILLGNGDGSFTPIPGPATGNLPIEIASADFNGDGIADLAVANSGDNTVSILLGNGDGTFTLKQNASAGLTPSGLVVGDFNGDGKVDFAEVDVNGNGGAVNLGQGDGTFIVSTNLNTGNAPYGLAIGDFNCDGIADLITTNFSGTTVTVILGAGDGSFVSSPPLTTIDNPIYVATGDFNGDGKSDFAITNGGTNTIPIYLSASSTGTATASATVTNISPVGTGPHLVDASYPGDSTYSASLSNTVSLTAQRVPTTLALTASIAPSGSPITLNAALSPNFAQNHAATGLVTFSSNGNTLGTGSISNGAATLVVTSLPAGTDALQAQYAGDTNFAPSSGTGSITIVPPPPPDFTFTGPTTITFRTESNGTATLVLTSFAGFAAPISITCNDPLPPNYLCTLSNSRVSLTANATASINLTLHPNLNAALTPPAGRRNPTLPIAFGALFPLTLLTLYRRRTRTLISTLLLLLCFAALTTALTACGSDIYYPATPPGIYPISLTATGTTQGSPTPTTHTLVVNANITP